MSKFTFNKSHLFVLVLVILLITGCANYGRGRKAHGVEYPASFDLGLAVDLLRNVGPLLDKKNGQISTNVTNTLRNQEANARRAEKKTLMNQKRKQRQQEEERRWAAMTPKQRQAEIDARRKRNDAIAAWMIEAMMNSPTGGNASGNAKRMGPRQPDYNPYPATPPAPSTPNAFGPGYTTPAW